MTRTYRQTIAERPDAVRDFLFVAELLLAASTDDPSHFDLRLLLCREPGGLDGDRLEVLCGGVVDLRVDGLKPHNAVGPLELVDLRARGWDGLPFRVFDPEQEEELRFSCVTLQWRRLAGRSGDAAV